MKSFRIFTHAKNKKVKHQMLHLILFCFTPMKHCYPISHENFVTLTWASTKNSFFFTIRFEYTVHSEAYVAQSQNGLSMSKAHLDLTLLYTSKVSSGNISFIVVTFVFFVIPQSRPLQPRPRSGLGPFWFFISMFVCPDPSVQPAKYYFFYQITS